jgi:hypothetical protein
MSELTPAQRLRLSAALGDGVTVRLSQHDAMKLAHAWEKQDEALASVDSMKMQHQIELQKWDRLSNWAVKAIFAITAVQSLAYSWLTAQ